jgi:hypothetical protein
MLSRPKAIAAAAVSAAAIAAVTAGCQSQDSIASAPAALSAQQTVSAHTAKLPRPHHTHDAKRHHKHTPKPAATPTTSTPAPTSSASASASPTSTSSSPTPAPTQSSPSPSPTTSTPTSTPTPTGTCTTSAAQGECGPYTDPQIEETSSNPSVGNNVWAPISGWKQTLYATNPGDWSVTANMPAGNTAVVSYPSSGSDYNGRALSSFSTLRGSFSENMNANSSTSAWAAYDIWANGGSNEIMIQHDFANNGACTYEATADFGGSGGVPVQKWGLCQFGSELVWKLTSGNEQTGSVDILAMLTWLESHGYLPASSTLSSIGYGWEIASTGGVNENFQVNSYSITAS